MANKDKFAVSAFKKYAFASIFASLSVSISSLVDSVLIGNIVGEAGLAATNIVFPIFSVLNMLGFIIANGMGVVIAYALGKCDVNSARKNFTIAFFMSVITSVLFMAAVALLYNNLYYLLGATPEILLECKQYGDVLLLGAPLFIITPTFIIALRSDAAPFLAALSSGVVIFFNIVLDLVFMLGFNMGIRGAALAIVIAEALGLLVCLSYFFKKKKSLKLAKTKIKIKDVGNIAVNGLALGSMYFFQFIAMVMFNNLLSKWYGVEQLAAFNVFNMIFLFAYAIFDGIASSVPPLVTNYLGEGDNKSIRTTYNSAIKLTVILSLALGVVIFVLAKPLTLAFGLTIEETVNISKLTLMCFAFGILPTCINIFFTSYIQSIGRPIFAFLITVLRMFVFILSFGVLFVKLYGVVGVPIAYIATECLSFAAILIYLFAVKKNKKYKSILLLKENENLAPRFQLLINTKTDTTENIAEEIEKFCEKNGIGFKKTFFINFIIEELALNIVKFGVNDKKQHIIMVLISIESEGIKIWIRDDVMSYNPFDNFGDEVDNAVIKMIKEKAITYNYQRKLIFNNLYLVI